MTEQIPESNVADRWQQMMADLVPKIADNTQPDKLYSRVSLIGLTVGGYLERPDLSVADINSMVASTTGSEQSLRDDMQEQGRLSFTEAIDPKSFLLGGLVVARSAILGKEAQQNSQKDKEHRAKLQERTNDIVFALFAANPENVTFVRLGELLIPSFETERAAEYESTQFIHLYKALKNLQELGLIDEESYQERVYGHLNG